MSAPRLFTNLLLLCALGVVPAAGADDTQGAEVGDAVTLAGRASNLNIDIRLSYSDDGLIERRQDTIRLSCSFPFAGHPDLVGYEEFVIESITFDDGTTLELETVVDREERFSDYVLERGEFSVNIPLSRIPDDAEMITAIDGRCIGMYKVGEDRLAELDPISTWLGKRVAVKDIPGAIIGVTEVGEDEAVVTYNTAAREALDEIVYKDASGREVPTSGYSGSGSGDSYTRRQRLRRELGEEGAVVFRFHGEVQRRELQVKVENVPVEMEPRKTVDAVISSTPASEAEVAEPPADAAGEQEATIEAVEEPRGAEDF